MFGRKCPLGQPTQPGFRVTPGLQGGYGVLLCLALVLVGIGGFDPAAVAQPRPPVWKFRF